MKLYTIVVVGVLFVAVMAGWLLPFLFSAKSTGTVIGGICILLLLPVFLFKLYRIAVLELRKEGKNEEMELRIRKSENGKKGP